MESELKFCGTRAVVVAQLVERLLQTPEIHGSNPNFGKIVSTNCTIKARKDKNKEKDAGNSPSLSK